MAQLHEQLAAAVEDWRKQGYPCDAHPAIAEILEWSQDTDAGGLRFLRRPQLRAVETYWYLRLVLNTPHVFELYRHFCPRPRELREALGLTQKELGEAVGVDSMTVSRWERGEFGPRRGALVRLERLRKAALRRGVAVPA